MSDDKFLHDSGILCGSFFTRRRLWVTDGRAGWLSGERMRCMQDPFLSPGAKGRGRLVFVGVFFPRRQETGDGPSSARGGRVHVTVTVERSEVSHHVRSYTRTYTKHSWMCIYKQRRAHTQIIRPDTQDSKSMLLTSCCLLVAFPGVEK